MSWQMEHYTLTVVGRDAVALALARGRVRERLSARGYSGWTETAAEGAWLDELEYVTVFTIYVDVTGRAIERAPELTTVASVAAELGNIGRWSMPDQTAIQVTHHGRVTVWEFNQSPRRGSEPTYFDRVRETADVNTGAPWT